MTEFLIFQIYGTVQAWGDIAVGEIRPVVDHPGRSGIAGLLAAALGLTRTGPDADAYLRLARSLRVAVRADVRGTPLSDYHTAQTPGRIGKREFATRREELAHEHQNLIPTYRSYTQDAAFTVCLTLAEQTEWPIPELAEALLRPRFVTYLGRKSCPPALPFAPRTGEFATVEAAFSDYPVAQSFLGRMTRRSREPRPMWWDVDLPTEIKALGEVTRRDLPVSRAGQFRFMRRIERYGTLPAHSEVRDVS